MVSRNSKQLESAKPAPAGFVFHKYSIFYFPFTIKVNLYSASVVLCVDTGYGIT